MTPKEVVKKGAAAVARAMARAGLVPRFVMLHIDGGICSQMHFLLVGRMLQESGCDVRYDLAWYDTCGKDTDGRFCRNFDLPKAFPELPLPTVTNPLLLQIYRSCFFRENDYYDPSHALDWTSTQAPTDLTGYFKDPDEMYTRVFRSMFRVNPELLDPENREVYRRIREAVDSESCAVHVRRGDLAKYDKAYGHPVDARYFADCAVELAKEKGKVKFWIFSDEPEWVRAEVLPLMGGLDATVCDHNGSDRGWCDLMLMSACRHQITSQGSMGKYAAMLRDEKDLDGAVYMPPAPTTPEWLPRFQNPRPKQMS